MSQNSRQHVIDLSQLSSQDEDDNRSSISSNTDEEEELFVEPPSYSLETNVNKRQFTSGMKEESQKVVRLSYSKSCHVKTHTTTRKKLLLLEDSSSSEEEGDEEVILRNRDILDSIGNNLSTHKSSSSYTAKQKAQLEKEYQRRKQQEDKLLEKQRQKQEKLRERQKQKELKQAQQMDEKHQKQIQKLERQQRNGTFAPQEIVVLADVTNIQDLSNNSKYLFQHYRSGFCSNVVQWIRRDFHPHGGAEEAYRELMNPSPAGQQFHLFPVIAVIVQPQEFLSFLQREEHESHVGVDEYDDDYPLLEEWIRGIQTGWYMAWKHRFPDNPNAKPRVILLLNQVKQGMEQQWVQYRTVRRQSTTSQQAQPISEEELQDAITWLLVQWDIECIHCSSFSDIQKEVLKMTMLLSFQPYQNPVTELQCVRKLKSQIMNQQDDPMVQNQDQSQGTAASSSGQVTAFDRAKDAWERQLQQIPGVGLSKARCFVMHYPTIQSLWRAYQNLEDEETKKLLVANCFSTDGRNYTRLAESVYRLLTSTDPNEVI